MLCQSGTLDDSWMPLIDVDAGHVNIWLDGLIYIYIHIYIYIYWLKNMCFFVMGMMLGRGIFWKSRSLTCVIPIWRNVVIYNATISAAEKGATRECNVRRVSLGGWRWPHPHLRRLFDAEKAGFDHKVPRFCDSTKDNYCTTPNTHMEPQNGGLEDESPFISGWFSGSMLTFGGSIIYKEHDVGFIREVSWHDDFHWFSSQSMHITDCRTWKSKAKRHKMRIVNLQ